MTEYYTVFERCLVEKQRRYRKQGIEPSSCLVDSFADKVCGELRLEHVLVFKRIVMLCKRHTSAVKPAVHNFGSTLHSTAALFALERNLVDIRLVKLDILIEYAEFLKFFFAADNLDFSAVRTYPYRKRRTPVSLSRNTPVDDVFEEVTHTAGADSRRHPVDGSVVFEKLVSDFRHLDKPAGTRIVKQRSIATPAERIAVLKEQFLE